MFVVFLDIFRQRIFAVLRTAGHQQGGDPTFVTNDAFHPMQQGFNSRARGQSRQQAVLP